MVHQKERAEPHHLRVGLNSLIRFLIRIRLLLLRFCNQYGGVECVVCVGGYPSGRSNRSVRSLCSDDHPT